MVLRVAVTGVFTTFSYFFIDDETNSGFLIDPGAQADDLLRLIDERGFTIEKILLTHGHFDHFGAADKIRRTVKASIIMHEDGRAYVESPRLNLSESCGCPMTLDDVTYLRGQCQITSTANPKFFLDMIHTPGHTPDSVTYYSELNGVAFVGDSIYQGNFGLTNFYGGNRELLIESVVNKILTLPDDTFLLSGHGEPVSVRDEKTFLHVH